MNRRNGLLILCVCGSIFVSSAQSFAQPNDELQDQVAALEARVRQLEDFVTTLNDQLAGYSNDFQANLTNYKKNLEASLDDYSRDLFSTFEERIRSLDDDVAVLSLTSKGYKQVETNSGPFLVSIQKVEKISAGVRLIFHVGNPNFASYQGITLQLKWGREWDPDSTVGYSMWRSSLQGADFTYNGRLEQGTWTEIAVDLSPVTVKQLEHIECALSVDSIQLNLKNPKFRP